MPSIIRSEKKKISRNIRKSWHHSYSNMKICLDSNCFIDAFNSNSKGYDAMRKILAFRKNGKLEIFVSLQTLSELAKRKDEAAALANSIDRLPHHGIGTWDEHVGTWKDEAGTWDEAKEDDERQKKSVSLQKLAVASGIEAAILMLSETI